MKYVIVAVILGFFTLGVGWFWSSGTQESVRQDGKKSLKSAQRVKGEERQRGMPSSSGREQEEEGRVGESREELRERYMGYGNEDFMRELEEIRYSSLSMSALQVMLEELFKAWCKHDSEEALDYLWSEEVEPVGVRFKAEEAFFQQYAIEDPESAADEVMAFLEEDPQRAVLKGEYLAAVALGWSASDPEQAFKWLQGVAEQADSVTGGALEKFFYGLTQSNEGMALELINALPAQEQAEAMKGMAEVWGGEARNWGQIEAQLAALPEDLYEVGKVHSLFQYARRSPQQTMGLVDEIAENSLSKNRVVNQVLNAQVETPAPQKIEWAMRNTTEDYVSHVNKVAFEPWIRSDQDEAIRWLLDQPLNPSTVNILQLNAGNPLIQENYQERIKERLEATPVQQGQ